MTNPPPAVSPSSSKRLLEFHVSGAFAKTFGKWKEAFLKGRPRDDADMYRMCSSAIEKKLLVPERALDPSTALSHLPPLRRFKLGPNFRIIFIASRESNLFILLYVGRRRGKNDRKDPYAHVGKKLERGDYDADIAMLERRPASEAASQATP